MPLGRYLLECGFIDPSQLSEARVRRKVVGGTLDESIAALGHMSRAELDRLLEIEIPVPESVEESGLESRFLLDFLLKTIYVHGFETSVQLAEFVRLSVFVIDELLEDLKEKRLIEVLGLTQDSLALYRHALTEAGRRWAMESLERCQYTGPAPVPLATYQLQVEKQSILREHVRRPELHRAIAHLVLAPELMDRLGPAVSSSSAILLYGPAGNGKSSIAEALGQTFQNHVLVPHCISVDGQIVKVFDPAVHEPVAAKTGRTTPESLEQTTSELIERTLAEVDGAEVDGGVETEEQSPAPESDPRWVRCRRPVVSTAGELTLEMRDLRIDPIAKYF